MTSETPEPAGESTTPYEQFGGEAFFEGLVHGFYERVARDPILRPMYPDEDLSAAERRLRMFLMQYWGGPQTYSEERGHPRLRMRHMDFSIDSVARDRWLSLMHDAVADMDMAPEAESQLWMYLVSAAFAMQNVPDDPIGQPLPTTQT
ncbi:MAG: globin [Actinomycetales bacterium]|nr:globin [Actinomycetales bacterium]